MGITAVIKRVVPFFLTFAAGLAIASIFISVSAPSFNWASKRAYRGHHKCERMRSEYRDLREENLRLKLENEQLREARTVTAFEAPLPPAPPAIRELKRPATGN